MRSAAARAWRGATLEVTPRQVDAVQGSLPRAAGARAHARVRVMVPNLPSGGSTRAALDAARALRARHAADGVEVVPHLRARGLESTADAVMWMEEARSRAGAEAVFVVSGDDAVPQGPFAFSRDLWAFPDTRAALCKFKEVGFPVYPVPASAPSALGKAEVESLARKAEMGEGVGRWFFVTQLVWDAREAAEWVSRLRAAPETRAFARDARFWAGVAGPVSWDHLAKLAVFGPLRGAVPLDKLRAAGPNPGPSPGPGQGEGPPAASGAGAPGFDPTALVDELRRTGEFEGVHVFALGSGPRTCDFAARVNAGLA